MRFDKYRNSSYTRHIWLGLAVFFLVFNSSPVKKFIRLRLYIPATVVESVTGQHVGNDLKGDCALIDRHEISSLVSQDIQHQAPDTDFTFLLSTLFSLALLFLIRTGPEAVVYLKQRSVAGIPVPIYIHDCRLQV